MHGGASCWQNGPSLLRSRDDEQDRAMPNSTRTGQKQKEEKEEEEEEGGLFDSRGNGVDKELNWSSYRIDICFLSGAFETGAGKSI